jgi:hypothetical protein
MAGRADRGNQDLCRIGIVAQNPHLLIDHGNAVLADIFEPPDEG